MHKRSKLTQLLATPIAVFLWLIGWSLYWIGHNKRKVNKKGKACPKELSFTVRLPEQKYAE